MHLTNASEMLLSVQLQRGLLWGAGRRAAVFARRHYGGCPHTAGYGVSGSEVVSFSSRYDFLFNE
jgi:hypothetical protein